MSYEVFEKTYKTLSVEQQLIVYYLVISLCKMNKNTNSQPNRPKRVFGKFAGIASAEFSDDWEMTEQELCDYLWTQKYHFIKIAD